MAIRFCKGKEESLCDAPHVILDSELFANIHAAFIGFEGEYVGVYDHDSRYLFCAYDDKNFHSINLHIWNLLSADINPLLLSDYKEVTIISCNEIAYYLYVFFKQNHSHVFLKGELWDVLLPEAEIVDVEKGFSIYAEGNMGLALSELGYWKTTIPYDEYNFLEQLYKTIKENRSLYSKNWLSKEETNTSLADAILSREPLMVARLGNTEAMIVQEFMHAAPSRLWAKWLYTVAGFFSKNEDKYDIDDINRYAEMTINAIRSCDYHCCRFDNEIGAINVFANNNSYYVDWYDLYTAFNPINCWLSALRKKRVLIVSSACDTISYQYNHNNGLFNNPYSLPEMELLFYHSIETQMGDKKGFSNWFEAYNKTLADIQSIDFDVALIAAGAYGYPLAAQIKKWGKQAIELCSGIYPVFGIKVKTQQTIRAVSSMYNQHWIFPKEQPPVNYMKIEKGSYWE